MHLLSFTWDPNQVLLDLGFFQLRYYSLMFVIAFSLGWFIMKRIYKNENQTEEDLDSLFIYTVLATLIGALLGHFLLYEPSVYITDPLSIILPFQFTPEFEFTGFIVLASHEAFDSLFIDSVLATLIGARLCHFLFLDPSVFITDPLSIILPFQFSADFEFTGFRGPASHGAAIGIIIAMYYYSRKIIKKPI